MASQYSSGPARPRERRHAELEAEQRHARVLVQCLGQPLCIGNRVRWLEEPLAELSAAVARTRQQLQLDQSLLRDAPAALHQALLAAARRGVHVALRGGAQLTPGAEALRRSGALLGLPSRWRRWWPRRQAALPLLLADGRFAFITPGGTQAPALALEGPVVPALQQAFLEDWSQRLQPELPARRYQVLQTVAGLQQLATVPPEHPQGAAQALRGALLQALATAQSRIRLSLAPGEKPGPALLRALCQAAWRGVDVQLLLSRPGRALGLLERSGACCRLLPAVPAPWPGPRGSARAGALPPGPALVVVDGLWAALGTPRLSDEPAPVLLDADTGAELERHFKRRFDAAARPAPG
ncbi:phospholipase D-like domain-containing protein [Azohydromonas caseinilytica]|uniref:Uncharacterized protein n=1 Tax=Azohydromonas caseinilytica TaxID=2728836 RepID=A0A848F1G4_9BURK|nr:hypothetical protein [Azohydromonas caseinilytica]NML13524.1 hypothetical protein [Azohydromonas caseinilytica]